MIKLKTFEMYFDEKSDVDGYVDANDIVGQRLWFHTNRTHRNNDCNGMIGIYDVTNSGRKTGYAGRYTNEVRLKSPIFFQTSEAGSERIKRTNTRHLISGVSGVVVPTDDDITDMIKITYSPFGHGYFHEIGDDREIISGEEVYFNATRKGTWELYIKNPIYK